MFSEFLSRISLKQRAENRRKVQRERELGEGFWDYHLNNEIDSFEEIDEQMKSVAAEEGLEFIGIIRGYGRAMESYYYDATGGKPWKGLPEDH